MVLGYVRNRFSDFGFHRLARATGLPSVVSKIFRTFPQGVATDPIHAVGACKSISCKCLISR